MTPHSKTCNAPICLDHIGEEVWYAGEEVCTKTPYQKFQKKQLDINKWVKLGKFRNMEEPYNRHDLETRSI